MMTLLEAVSPTARESLADADQSTDSGGYCEFDPKNGMASSPRLEHRPDAGQNQTAMRRRQFRTQRSMAGNDPGAGLQALLIHSRTQEITTKNSK